jgi:hypothetical protein
MNRAALPRVVHQTLHHLSVVVVVARVPIPNSILPSMIVYYDRADAIPTTARHRRGTLARSAWPLDSSKPVVRQPTTRAWRGRAGWVASTSSVRQVFPMLIEWLVRWARLVVALFDLVKRRGETIPVGRHGLFLLCVDAYERQYPIAMEGQNRIGIDDRALGVCVSWLRDDLLAFQELGERFAVLARRRCCISPCSSRSLLLFAKLLYVSFLLAGRGRGFREIKDSTGLSPFAPL